MKDVRHRRTRRLQLDQPTIADVEQLYELHSDPAVWEHLPSGRHTSRERTETFVAGVVERWLADGLGYWTARPGGALIERFGDHHVLGIGGCEQRDDGTWWNLYYRFAVDTWGLGLATELAMEATAAAGSHSPDLPIVAFLLEHNIGSRKVAERCGFTLVWRGPDAGNPDPASIRLIFADRDLDPNLLARIAAST